MKAATMARRLRNYWDVEESGWPPFVCMNDKEFVSLVMRADNWGYVMKAIAGGLRCYQKIGDEYKLVKHASNRESH